MLCHAESASLTLAKPLCHAERTTVLHCAASLRREGGFTLCTNAAHNECAQCCAQRAAQSAQHAQRRTHHEHAQRMHNESAQWKRTMSAQCPLQAFFLHGGRNTARNVRHDTFPHYTTRHARGLDTHATRSSKERFW